MVEIRNGKEKLITFIKAAVREDVDKLVFEHENLRLQCQQLVNQVKVLAQEQLELVNLVMLHHSYISSLERKQTSLHARFKGHSVPANSSGQMEECTKPTTMTLEMQVFDEMQRIIEKYKQQMEAMDDSGSKLLEPSAHLMSLKQELATSAAKEATGTSARSKKRKKQIRTLYVSRLKQSQGKGKPNAEDCEVQTEKIGCGSQKKSVRPIEFQQNEDPEETTVPYLQEETNYQRCLGEGMNTPLFAKRAEKGQSQRLLELTGSNGPKRQKLPLPGRSEPHQTVSHLFSLLDELKLVSSFGKKNNSSAVEEEALALREGCETFVEGNLADSSPLLGKWDDYIG